MIKPIYNDFWSNEVKALYRHDIQEIWDNEINRHIFNQYNNQLRLYLSIAQKIGKKKILDIGCAQATLALKLAEAGFTVTAMDIRQEFLDYAKSRYEFGDIKFVKMDVLTEEIYGEYDLIFLNQIVEHVVYPKVILNKLRENLKSGGVIVITTPNHEYLTMHLPSYLDLGNLEDWEHLQNSADGDGHFFAYKLSELSHLTEECGYKVQSKTYFESPFISGHVKIRYIHKFIPVSLLRIFDALLCATPLLRRLVCHQLLVIARKY